MKKALFAVCLIACIVLSGCIEKGKNNIQNDSETINTSATGENIEIVSTTEPKVTKEQTETTEGAGMCAPVETTEVIETIVSTEPESTTEPEPTTETTVATDPVMETTEETFPVTLPPEWDGIETERDES